MKQLTLEEFKNIVYCKNNVNAYSPMFEGNFGISIKNSNGYNIDEIEFFIKEVFPIKYITIPCCRITESETILSGYVKIPLPEGYDKDSYLILNDAFIKLENDLINEFDGLQFELIIIENNSDYINYEASL